MRKSNYTKEELLRKFKKDFGIEFDRVFTEDNKHDRNMTAYYVFTKSDGDDYLELRLPTKYAQPLWLNGVNKLPVKKYKNYEFVEKIFFTK